ncbi:hypothetical protein GCM10027456_52990 [Kineosporia babensis]
MLRAPDPELDDVVRRQLLIQSAEAARVSNLLGFGLITTAVTVLALGGAPIGGLIGWAVLRVAWTVFFHLAAPAWITGPARDPSGPPPQRLAHRFTAAQIVAGATWGSGCLWVRPDAEHASLVAVPVAVLMLANAANLLFCSATPNTYRAFHASICATGAVGLLSQGNWALTAFVVFGALGAPPLARYGYQQVAGARLLARQNALLAEELRQERESAERVNLRLSELNVELQHRATRDPLTGLPNRSLFFDHLTSALRRSRESGRAVGVVFFDLDHFKQVNDKLGHGAGDDLLRHVAGRVTGVLRSSDVLARLGGDELVILLATRSGTEEFARVAERVRQVLEAPFDLAAGPVRISSSLGLALDDGHCTAEQLVEYADVALYRAKQLGRNRSVLFQPAMLDTT